jgi:Tol biopolymer transport system component
MKRHILFWIGLFLLSGTTLKCYSQGIKHPYSFNHQDSGPRHFKILVNNKEIFAAHITFTPDGNEFYFVTDSGEMEIIKYSRFLNGKWSEARTAPFAGKYRIETPHINQDGTRFFFARSSEDLKSSVICVMEKVKSGWSEPKPLDKIINNGTFTAGPATASNGNLYFFSDRLGGWKAFCSKYKNGKYSEPVPLDTSINKYSVSELYIAPDESYLLFGRYVSENNWRDIYISFRKNNSWSTALSLGNKINSYKYEGRPCISPDGNYLFYSKDIPTKIYQVEWKPLLDSLKRSLNL